MADTENFTATDSSATPATTEPPLVTSAESVQPAEPPPTAASAPNIEPSLETLAVESPPAFAPPAEPIPAANIAELQAEFESVVSEHNAQAIELREQLEACVRRRQALAARRVVRVASGPCPKHSLYKHYIYYLEWTNAQGEIIPSPNSEHCASGRCASLHAAEHHASEQLELNFAEWSNLQARSSVLRQERQNVVGRLEDLESRMYVQQPEQSLADLGLPSPQSRLLDLPLEALHIDQPQPVAAVPYADEAEREAQKQAVLEAVRRGQFPAGLTTRDEAGNVWVRGQESVPYTSVSQLLSPEHQQDTDVWVEILRKNPNEVSHITPTALDDPKIFLWMLQEKPELVKAALPNASPRVHNDARVMMKAMGLDWTLVKRFGGTDLRNDSEVAVEAIRHFDEDMRDTMEWIGPQPKDSAIVMATAAYVQPNALVHASPRLRHSPEFARKVLADSYQLAEQVNEKTDADVTRLSETDWRVQKRLATETRHETATGVLRMDVWRGLEAILDRLGEEPKADPEAMQLAVLQDGRALKHVADVLRKSRDFILGTLQAAKEKLSHAKALAVSVWMSRNLPDELRDDEEIARRAIELSAGQSIMDCWSPRLRGDRRFVLDAMQSAVFRGKMLAHVSDELKDDEEVVLTALATDGAAIKEASPRLRSDKTFLQRAFQAATDPIVVNKLASLFQRLAGGAGDDRSHKMEAAERLTIHVADLPDDMADDPDVVLASLENGGSLAGVSERLLADAAFALRAIERFGKKVVFDQFLARFNEHVVSYLQERVRDDERVMLASIKKHGGATRFASNRLRRDPAFAKKAVTTTDDAKSTVQYLDTSLRDDEAVMTALVDKDAKLAVQLASSRLKGDLKFAKRALARAPNAEELKPALQAALDKEKPTTPTAKAATPRRQPNQPASKQEEPIQPLDVAIVAAVIVFGLLLGLMVYLNPVIGAGIVVAVIALGVFIFMGSVAFAPPRQTDQRERPPDRSSGSTSRSRGSRTESDVHYNRKGQIEDDDRESTQEFQDR